MNNIITNWENIVNEAVRLGMPDKKKRAILREYLQALILAHVYSFRQAKNLSFIGGTSLRLLRGLGRFSEDLDFDNLGLTDQEIHDLFAASAKKLGRVSLDFEFEIKASGNGAGHGGIKFIKILFDLGISKNPREKLRIDWDYTTPGVKRETENIIYSNFGLVTNVVTNTLPAILIQKAEAFLGRKDPQARDMYDLVWLLSQNIKPNLKADLVKRLIKRYRAIKPDLERYKRSLKPFLVDEKEINKLDYFAEVVTGCSRSGIGK